MMRTATRKPPKNNANSKMSPPTDAAMICPVKSGHTVDTTSGITTAMTHATMTYFFT